MITLDVADYCHDCPGFETDLRKDNALTHNSRGTIIKKCETVVTCEYRGRCESIYNYIKKQFEKESKE